MCRDWFVVKFGAMPAVVNVAAGHFIDGNEPLSGERAGRDHGSGEWRHHRHGCKSLIAERS